MNIQQYVQKTSDFRRGQGKRYPLDSTLIIILMSLMSGYAKYREIHAFAKRHEATLTALFSLKHGVPSHVTIREIISKVDFTEVLHQFNAWSESLISCSDNLSDDGSDNPVVINIDGKSIRSSLKEYSSAYQDFLCFAHVYAAKQGIVIQTAS